MFDFHEHRERECRHNFECRRRICAATRRHTVFRAGEEQSPVRSNRLSEEKLLQASSSCRRRSKSWSFSGRFARTRRSINGFARQLNKLPKRHHQQKPQKQASKRSIAHVHQFSRCRGESSWHPVKFQRHVVRAIEHSLTWAKAFTMLKREPG